MKFAMGTQTLGNLAKKTQGASDHLGSLIRQLVAAVEPLEGRFQGAGKQAFDRFKHDADHITMDLKSALGSIVTGQQGMDHAFQHGDAQMADNASSAAGSANFEAARFSAHHRSTEG